MNKLLFILSCLTSIIASCQDSSKLEKTLSVAGVNRIELEKTLSYYRDTSPDSLKFKAAVYLIENMITQYSYKSSFYEDLEKSNARDITQAKYLIRIYNGDFNKKVLDCQIIKSDFLIKNI